MTITERHAPTTFPFECRDVNNKVTANNATYIVKAEYQCVSQFIAPPLSYGIFNVL